MKLKEKLSNLIEEIYSINSDIDCEIDSIKTANIIEIKKLQLENKELKAKVTYLELNKEGIEQKDDILFKQNEDLKQSIENLEGKLISKGNLLSEQKEENKHLKITLKLSKNKILELKDLYEQEKNKNYKTLESEELKQEIEKLKKENEQLKNISCTIVVDNDGKLDSLFNQKLKLENEKLKDILNEIHEICFSTWGAPLPYCEVRRLLNVIRKISKIG